MKSVVVAVALVLSACAGADESRGTPAQPATTSEPATRQALTDPSSARSAVALPSHEDASPTQLRVTNARSEAIRLVVSFGAGQPFEIVSREGLPRYQLGGSGSEVPTDGCACRCGYECYDCEPPLHEEKLLQPGEHHDFEWSGRVRVYDGGCFEPYAAPTGASTFRACTGDLGDSDRECVEVTAELPAERVELSFD